MVDVLTVLKFLPKITLTYLLFCLIYHIDVNNFFLALTVILDIIDYLA